MPTLAGQIATLTPGKHQLIIDGLALVVYYDEQPATGDDNRPVRGDVTGEYEVFEQTLPDDLVLGLAEIHRQHVSPHGTSGYGNPQAKAYAAARCADAITARLRRTARAACPTDLSLPRRTVTENAQPETRRTP